MSSLKLPPLYNDGLEFGTMSQISLSVTFVKNFITAAVKFKAGLKWKSPPHTHLPQCKQPNPQRNGFEGRAREG